MPIHADKKFKEFLTANYVLLIEYFLYEKFIIENFTSVTNLVQQKDFKDFDFFLIYFKDLDRISN